MKTRTRIFFAAAAEGAAGAAEPVKGKPGRKPGQSNVAPALTGVSAVVPMPPRPVAAARGTKSVYPFDALEVGQSFGVTNKTAEQLASIVSNQNKRNRVPMKDANGNIVYETTAAKGPNGEDIQVPTTNPKLVDGKTFFAVNSNPKTDPEKATARVFRDK